MKIKDYIEMTGLSVAAFARAAETSPQAVHRWVNGSHPYLSKLLYLEKITNRKITIEDYDYTREDEEE